MGVTEDSVERLRRDFPGIAVVARQGASASAGQSTLMSLIFKNFSGAPSGTVTAVRVRIRGISGRRSRIKCYYELIIDTSDLQRTIPTVWVTSPADQAIKHVNIWPAHKSFCPYAGKSLPSFCWNTFADGWARAPRQSRTLGNALEYAKQLLNTENHDSPAR